VSFQVWLFGDYLCSVWLAVDVWMCTASILNLCAISQDRYLAVTRPVQYPSLMTSFRAKVLVVIVWVLSFVICLPPLVGWRDAHVPAEASTVLIRNELYHRNGTGRPQQDALPPSCPWICELPNNKWYVVYSALGSFYIPMFVMLFFYWRIYKAAVHTTRAINQGFRTMRSRRTFGNRFDEQRLTLRIHRGRGLSLKHAASTSSTATAAATPANGSGSRSPDVGRPPSSRRPSVRRSNHERIKISVSYPSSDCISAAAAAAAVATATTATPNVDANGNSPPETLSQKSRSSFSSTTSPTSSSPLYTVHYTAAETYHHQRAATVRSVAADSSTCQLRVSSGRRKEHHRRCSAGDTASPHSRLLLTSTPGGDHHNHHGAGTLSGRTASCSVASVKDQLSPSPSYDESTGGGGGGGGAGASGGGDGGDGGLVRGGLGSTNNKSKFASKMMGGGKRNIKAQVKRFRMETKAAKTLGIIVGGFIVCWLPFFTMYLVRAFCPTCIQPTLFSVMFWLGYCNSAINPMIYALFSKDFRFAFKRIICRWCCWASAGDSTMGGGGLTVADYGRRKGSDGSQLGAGGHGGASPRHRYAVTGSGVGTACSDECSTRSMRLLQYSDSEPLNEPCSDDR